MPKPMLTKPMTKSIPTGPTRPVMTCSSCGATCREAKHLGRFTRRHPRLCTKRKEFTAQLAAGTRSVDADYEEEKEN